MCSCVAGGGGQEHNNSDDVSSLVSKGDERKRVVGLEGVVLGAVPLISLQLLSIFLWGPFSPGTTNYFISNSAISCFHQENQYELCSQSTSC